MTPMRVLGMISGTSLDAIDVAVVDLAPIGPGALSLELVGWSEQPWPPDLRRRLEGWLASDHGVPLAELGLASMAAGEAFAEAASAGAEAAAVDLARVDLVASHGQTLHHRVGADGRAEASLQVGQPAVIAERTGRTVVADLRPRDIAAGGQGAPLVAFFDAAVFGDAREDVAVLNLGGIANLTFVPASGAERVIAFDTGPGNAVIDALARMLLGERFDRDGATAAAGGVSEPLLTELLADPYFARPAPKSTGRELFSDQYAASLAARGRARGLGDADLLASATELTARSVAFALRDLIPAWPARLYTGGGGAANPILLERLRAAISRESPPGAGEPRMESVDSNGVPSAAKEAIAFALLGHETLHGRPNSLASATGARNASVLGAIWPGTNYRDLLGQVAASDQIGAVVRRVAVRR
jgi:anhydro-N-acetylmuramic acid kinase